MTFSIDEEHYFSLGKLTSTPRHLLRRTEFQSLFDDFFLSVLTDHGEDFSNIKPAILIDTCEVARLSCEGIRSMKKNDVDFGVHLDEGLEVTGTRQSKIDAIERLTKNVLVFWEPVLIVSELKYSRLIRISQYLIQIYTPTPV